MVKVSEAFGLGLTQGELDFVDVDPSRDLRFFVDPYAIQINSVGESDPFYDHLMSFFTSLLDALRQSNDERVAQLVRNLREPKDTFLGVSRGRPDGRGIGPDQSMALVRAIRESEAFRTGRLEDLSEAELFVPGVGPDKVSDLSTNVLRQPLITYTQRICTLHEMEMTRVAAAPAWNMEEERWESHHVELPVINRQPVLLVPKSLIRKRLILDSQEYYDYYLDVLQAELEVTEGLASALRGARGGVTKERLKERYPFDKAALSRFAQEDPEGFLHFKELARSKGPINDSDIDPDYLYAAATGELVRRIRELPTGQDHASEYEKLIAAAVTLLFWPDLTFPIAQRTLHRGRKRLDLEFSVYANRGFWFGMRNDPFAMARTVPVECKNYGGTIANEEFDQLIGRFSQHRGRIGFLFYRSASDTESIRQRQRMAVADRQGYPIAVSDDELFALLGASRLERDRTVAAFLDRKFRDLVAFN